MRIVNLNLIAYGHFTRHVLDFGEAPGFHIIYGPNEAGKSTTLRALTSVLFGYPHFAEDDFRHSTADMAIGAELISKVGRKLSFIRKRRGRNTLTDASGARLDETAVSQFLGGLTKTNFMQVFALDHHRLHEYAHALLEEGGELGTSLAAAGAGIAGLNALLAKLAAQRSEIFNPKARNNKPPLNELIDKLTGLRAHVREYTVSRSVYKKRYKEIRDIEEALERARERQKEVAVKIHRLRRIQKNLALRARHAACLHTLQELDSIPLLPSGVSEQRIRAQTDRKAAEENLTAANREIEALQSKIASITLDEHVLGARAEIRELAGRRPVIEQQQKDLPRREAELRQHMDAVRDLLADAGIPGNPENLSDVLIPAVKRQEIRNHLDDGKALAARSQAALKQADDAINALAEAKSRLEHTPKPLDTANLARVLTDADRLGDIENDIAHRLLTHERKSRVLRETIIGLGIASGAVSDLRMLQVPPTGLVEHFDRELDSITAELKTLAADIARLRAEIADIDDKISQIQTVGTLASEDDLRKARESRDEAWNLVRRIYVEKQAGLDDAVRRIAPDGRIPEAYEKLVWRADQVADTIRDHLAEVTELSLLSRKKAQLEQKLNETLAQEQTRSGQKQTLLAEWKALWPSGMMVHLPNEMLEWLEQRAQALIEAGNLGTEYDEIETLRTRQANAAKALREALQALGIQADDETLDALRSRAHALIEQAAEQKTALARAKEAVDQLSSRKTAAEHLVSQLKEQTDAWTTQWKALLASAGLNPDLSMDAATLVLEVMGKLDVKKSEINSLKRRIETMTAEWTTFHADVARLAERIPGLNPEDPIKACLALEARLAKAEADENELTQHRKTQRVHEATRQLADRKLRESEAILASLCAQAGCTNPAELAGIEQKSETKKKAQQECEAIEARVLEDGGGLDLQTLFAECEGVNADEIPEQIRALEEEANDLTRQIDDLMPKRAEMKAEFNRLLIENQAAESHQTARNVEAQIAETVEDYVDLTVEEILLRQAIELYRQRNQGPILERAGALFSALTEGAYTGLRADFDDRNQPILLAVHRTRGSLEVKQLSDGTVDPLYLALRLAAVQAHNETREPMPFIADDLLLNLDGPRSRAALRMLSQIAADGQVLFFTHHEHMLDLARDEVPENLLRTHTLVCP